MTCSIYANGLRFDWSEVSTTVNVFPIGSDEALTSCSLSEKAKVKDFKGYVKRWLKDNGYDTDEYLFKKRELRSFKND